MDIRQPKRLASSGEADRLAARPRSERRLFERRFLLH